MNQNLIVSGQEIEALKFSTTLVVSQFQGPLSQNCVRHIPHTFTRKLCFLHYSSVRQHQNHLQGKLGKFDALYLIPCEGGPGR